MDRDELTTAELPVERAVSSYLADMPFLWLEVDDEPGPESLRGVMERNAIALLSNFGRGPLDAPSTHWLGHASDRELVRRAGLWNQRHVDEAYDAGFLDEFELMIERMRPHSR